MMNDSRYSDCAFVPTALLAMFLGAFRIHRFYVGKIGTGILMLLTLGGFGIWTLIDYVMVITDGFTDAQGRVISRNQQFQPESHSGFVPAFFLCAFLGWLGAHRFYTGKYLTAILMILTFGGLGIWVLIDSVLLVTGGFRDGEGKLV